MYIYIYIYNQTSAINWMPQSWAAAKNMVFQLPASNKTHTERVPLEGPFQPVW